MLTRHVAYGAPADDMYSELPLWIHNQQYHSLYPLPFDTVVKDRPFAGAVYKVTSSADGRPYCLRR